MRTIITIICALCGVSPGLAETPLETRLKADIVAAERQVEAPKTQLTKLEKAAEEIWKKLEQGAGQGTAEAKVADKERRELMAKVKALAPDQMKTRAEFDAYDRLVLSLRRAEEKLKLAVASQKRIARETGEKALVEELATIEKQIAATEKELENAGSAVLAAKTRLKTYTLPPPPPGKIAGDGFVKINPPVDAAARAKRFAERNLPERIAELAWEFFLRVDVNTPGLEKAKQAIAENQPAAALDAWRDYFFAKLREPQKHGLPPNWGGDLDTASLLRVPNAASLEDAMRGTFSTPRAKANVGEPGTINWADPGPDPTVDPARNAMLDFYTMRGQLGFVDVVGPHLVLLNGFAATGEKRYLDRWAAILDDWAMNAPADMERSPFNIRQYPVLCSFRPVALASTLTDALAAQPSLATALPAPTLARLMLTVMEEYPAAYVRLARRGIYNWICIAATGAVLTAQVFPEFHAARWQLNETRRFMELNWTHKTLRDGGNLEAGNWGHEPNDQVHLGRAVRLLENQPPAWLDAAWRAEWHDNVKMNARYYLHVLKPDGMSYKFSRVATAGMFMKHGAFDDPAMGIQTNLLLDEAESRRRLEWVFGDSATDPPHVFSESLAYLGQAFLRGGWAPDDSFVFFHHSPNRDTGGRNEANGFSLYDHGHCLLLAPPLTVDGRKQNICHGLVRDPGGKTVYLTHDDRGVPTGQRFHTSEKFDFAEGEYRGAYELVEWNESEMFGDYGYKKLAEDLRKKGGALEPVLGVAHQRQIFSIRGEGVFIVVDRIHSESKHQFAQDYTLHTPVPREGWKRRVELAREEQRAPVVIDAAARTLRTDNGSLPGVTVRHFGTLAPRYSVTDDLFGKAGEAESADEALASLGSSKLKKWTMGLPLPFAQKVRAEFHASGEQLLVTVIATRAGFESSDLREVTGLKLTDATGFRAITRTGKKMEFSTALDGAVMLKVGDAGIALNTKDGDFEFGKDKERLVIHRTIAPVVISPVANVFVDSQQVELTCATPGMEIRYTLDGTDPTIESALYRGPFKLTETTRVKSRAFRPGLAETPWTAGGTHATAMSWTTYEKQSAFAPVVAQRTQKGLAWEYIEGRWAQLFSDATRLPAKKRGTSPVFLDTTMRSTDGAFAIRGNGLIDVPADGIYTLHAPAEFMSPSGECGYDLRVFVHGHEWQPATRRHGYGTWSIALKKGAHPMQVIFVDFRPRKPKFELWDNFPHPAILWTGTTPTLEISGPGIERLPLPTSWLVEN